jgi:cellulase/cellobiase CelA1
VDVSGSLYLTKKEVTDKSPSDTRARISVVEENLKDVPCNQLAAFVIYDLPGRDCAAKASNGELAAGDISTYKSEYIDRKCISMSI